MAQPTQHEWASSPPAIMEAQIRESYGRVAYSHKVHEKSADIYLWRLNLLKIIQILLAAITTGGLIVTLLGQGNLSTIIAAVASTILLALNMYTKELNLGELAQRHSSTASDLWDVRESYLSLLADIVGDNITLEEIRARRDKLQEQLKNVYSGAPRTTAKAYSMARKALKLNGELTFSDAEIDMLLPATLRKGSTD
jgi:hypothetical protein